MENNENNNIKTDIQTLKQQAEEWAVQNLGKLFKFRKGQLESIV